ncbi:hypothetical protein CPB84DRAFT_1781827 [Gymnopilus junonius]|uniref:Uncharacterized protein n=1 Tax=Gymnopilus junonius TaxID=109634 RepID=A0A9P5TL74_GYMJU|nr:hypothetical protein CPB84DRAFT_1781827 [Gymnopilus junonius]
MDAKWNIFFHSLPHTQHSVRFPTLATTLWIFLMPRCARGSIAVLVENESSLNRGRYLESRAAEPRNISGYSKL